MGGTTLSIWGNNRSRLSTRGELPVSAEEAGDNGETTGREE